MHIRCVFGGVTDQVNFQLDLVLCVRRDGHVIIDQDRYFDFIDVEDVKKIVQEYVYQ